MEIVKEDPKGQSSRREFGIDVMRAFAMFLVIMGHLLGRGGLVESVNEKGIAYGVDLFLFVFSLCSINIFGLISGYVGYGRKFKPVSLVELWLRIVFWTVIISSLFVILGGETIDVNLLKITFLPIISKSYWYMTAYFVVAILSPVLNIIIERLDGRLLWIMVIITTFLLSVVLTTSGNNAMWLLLLYIYGALIKKEGRLREKSIFIGIIGFLSCVVITFTAYKIHGDGIISLNRYFWGFFCGKAYGLWPSSIMMLLASVFILLVGINLQTSEKANKVLRIITPLILSVYLIHVHPLLYGKLEGAMVWLCRYGLIVEVCGVVFITVGIYVICLFLDYWRERLFKHIKCGISFIR